MASVIGDIAITVGADIGPLVRELVKGSAAVSKFGADAQKGGAGMALATKAGIALGAAVVGAGVALASMTSAAMENIDALSKQARIAGVSVATFQAMAQVAEEAGVSSEELSKSIVKMQDAIGNAAKGTQAQVDAFAALGLSASNFAGLKTDEQFSLLAEKISGIEDPVKRTSVALDIFGKSGAGLTDMMTGYGDAVANAAKFQSDFGLAVSDIDAQKIEAANDAMDRTKQAIAGLGTELAVTFAPALEAVSLGLQKMVHDLFGAQTAMGDVFGKEGVAKAILGPELYNQLNSNAEAFSQNASRVGELKGALESLNGVSDQTANVMQIVSDNLNAGGYSVLSGDLQAVATEMNNVNDAFANGAISFDEYKARMEAAKARATELLGLIQEISGADMTEAIGQIAALGTSLDNTAAKARTLAIAMSATGAAGTAGASASASGTIKIGYAPDTSPRPLKRPMDLGDYGSSGGGGGGTDTTAADLKAMQDRFASESELLQAKYDADLLALETFRQSKQLSDEAYNALELQVKADHEQALADIEDKARSERFDAYSGAFSDLAALMASSNDKLFKIGQAASIGKAVVDGYEAAVSAWKHGMAIGGPGLATAFTAASLAKTGALIAGIASASPRGGGGGQSSGGGSTASSGGGASASSAPLQVMLNTRGSGDMISMMDWGMALDRITEVAGDRGYIITRAAS